MTLVIAAHGTRSVAGSATTAALAHAVAAARPDVPVTLCFLDVAEPSLADCLDGLAADPVDAAEDAVVVPLLLSAGYHVLTDIPAIVAGRPRVRVAAHLGPDPLIVAAVAERLAAAQADRDATVLLAAIASSRSSARAEVDCAAAGLAAHLGRPVEVVALGGQPDLTPWPGRLAIATYLLAEGGFLDNLRAAAGPRAVIADPIGVHPALIELIWQRHDAAVQ